MILRELMDLVDDMLNNHPEMAEAEVCWDGPPGASVQWRGPDNDKWDPVVTTIYLGADW